MMGTRRVLQEMQTTPRFGHVKVLSFKLGAFDQEKRTVEGYASTPVKDLQDEIVLPEAFSRDLAEYMRIPTVTWMHDRWGVPPGHTEFAEVRDDGLFVQLQINKTAQGWDIWEAITAGSLRALSIGFDGEYSLEWGYEDKGEQAWVWTRVALREIAIVSLPANREATFELAKSLGLEGRREGSGASPPGPLSPEFARELEERGRTAQTAEDEREMVEEERAQEDLARLKGSAEAIRNISRHWDKTGGAPSARTVDAAVSPITALAGIVKAGRVLSAANRPLVEAAIEALQGVLARDDESRASEDGTGEGEAPSPPSSVPELVPSPEGGGGNGDGEGKTITVSRPQAARLIISR